MFPNHIQQIIATYKILGFLPLDKFLHFIVGLIVTAALRYTKFSFKTIFFVILGLCIVKEIIDIQRLNSSFLESLADTLVTYIYPVLLWGAVWMKRKLSEEETVK